MHLTKDKKNNASLLLMFIFALLLLLSSLFAFIKESAPFFSGRISPETRFEHFEMAQEVKIGLSIYAHQLELNDCLEALAEPFGMAQPISRRMKVFSSCQTLSMDIVKSSPLYSYAWFIAAFSSVHLGQYEDFNYQLEQSQNTAPNEQWLAELRANLAENNLTNLSPAAIKGQERDLILLVKSKRGVVSIARRYVNDPSFRKRIIALVETLPESQQAKFINNVRAAANNIPQRRGQQ